MHNSSTKKYLERGADAELVALALVAVVDEQRRLVLDEVGAEHRDRARLAGPAVHEHLRADRLRQRLREQSVCLCSAKQRRQAEAAARSHPRDELPALVEVLQDVRLLHVQHLDHDRGEPAVLREYWVTF